MVRKRSNDGQVKVSGRSDDGQVITDQVNIRYPVSLGLWMGQVKIR